MEKIILFFLVLLVPMLFILVSFNNIKIKIDFLISTISKNFLIVLIFILILILLIATLPLIFNVSFFIYLLSIGLFFLIYYLLSYIFNNSFGIDKIIVTSIVSSLLTIYFNDWYERTKIKKSLITELKNNKKIFESNVHEIFIAYNICNDLLKAKEKLFYPPFYKLKKFLTDTYNYAKKNGFMYHLEKENPEVYKNLIEIYEKLLDLNRHIDNVKEYSKDIKNIKENSEYIKSGCHLYILDCIEKEKMVYYRNKENLYILNLIQNKLIRKYKVSFVNFNDKYIYLNLLWILLTNNIENLYSYRNKIFIIPQNDQKIEKDKINGVVKEIDYNKILNNDEKEIEKLCEYLELFPEYMYLYKKIDETIEKLENPTLL